VYLYYLSVMAIDSKNTKFAVTICIIKKTVLSVCLNFNYQLPVWSNHRG